MEHYYSKKQSSEYTEEKAMVDFNGRKFVFLTSSGVFSRKYVDFGSSLLIRSFLEDFKKNSARILDMGCGYGPIGIVIASFLEDSTVVMADVNERAVELAGKNIISNGTCNASVQLSDAYSGIEGKFDAVVTNPPIRAGKAVVHSFLEGAYDKLETGGSLYCVIQKKQGAESSFSKLKEVFGNCEVIARKSGYRIMKSTRT